MLSLSMLPWSFPVAHYPTEVIPMNYDIQKASMLKRFSAYLFDFILLLCLVVAFATGISSIVNYDGYNDRLDAIYEDYGQRFGINISMSLEEYNNLTEEDLKIYAEAIEAINADEEAIGVYSMVINLTLIIATVSILLAYVALELVVPLLFGNGQTLGKKAFGIGLMRLDGVKVTPFMMVVRTLMGKYVVETMIPVLIVIMLLFNVMSFSGVLIIGLILLLQVILLVATRTHSAIHDKMACTVAVDLASQRIFESPEMRLEYLKKISAEETAKAEY